MNTKTFYRIEYAPKFNYASEDFTSKLDCFKRAKLRAEHEPTIFECVEVSNEIVNPLNITNVLKPC